MNLFVYGTLMEPDLRHSLTGQSIRAEPACLLDFQRFQNPRGYPYILASPGGRVDGMLLHGIDDKALQALDRYEAEGDLYLRTKVVVATDGGRCPCEAYIGNPSAVARLGIS